MGIDYIFVWYQQKIGAYDKQKWETKIEQREQRIYGFNHIQTRSTKPNTELIDLDLVRGSSFTKAKPKHGFLKVSRLATWRYIFFPFYGKWWIEQTSGYVFALSLFLYVSQIINIFIYFLHTTVSTSDTETLSCMEIIIPFIMMWVLSLIHSQIVSTSPSTEIKKPRVRQKHYRRRRSYIKKKRKSEEQDEQNPKTDNTVSISEKDLENRIESVETDSKRKRLFFSEMEQSCDKNSDATVTNKEIVTQNVEVKDVVNEENNSIDDTVESDSDTEEKFLFKQKKKVCIIQRSKVQVPQINITSQDSNCDTEDEAPSSPEMRQSGTLTSPLSGDLTSSATDWIGVTTNSEDCSYSSDLDNISDSQMEKDKEKDYATYDNDLAPTAILNRPSVRVSCIIWERNEIKKADLSMLDISSAIIGKVESMPESMDYFYIGIFFSTVLAFLPIICKVLNSSTELSYSEAQNFLEEVYTNITAAYIVSNTSRTYSVLGYYKYFFSEVIQYSRSKLYSSLSGTSWEYVILTITFVQRWVLSAMIFFLLAVAERTFKQRLLYAKLFSHLTSSRRARKSDLPHFRLNKVINIKTWLSVRSYLKKRGPQRSVDVIVSTAFVANLLLLTFLCVEVLKDTVLFSQYYLEALLWCLGLGILLLRFMTLGTKINKKYRNLSVLITEQINLHLQIEQKPHKKEEFNVANNVLKLAIDLLKELENPFKISGISANPILYNVTKLVILSALSGVLSEMLGFKLKLHKIKLK